MTAHADVPADISGCETVIACWDERPRCKFVRLKTGRRCRRAAIWVGRQHEHGPTIVCTQHYHEWLHWAEAQIAKKGYFLCSACKGSPLDRKFRSPEEAVTIHRL
jgi:hypothetical protein